MRKYIFILCIAYSAQVIGQEIIYVNASYQETNFEYLSDTNYILRDTSGIWYIGKPQKNYLNIPDNIAYLGENCIYTDTNLYYQNNSKAFIQFNLFLLEADFYQFSFYQAYDFEPNKDGGIIETSHDSGLTWTNIIFDTLIVNEYFDGYLYDIDDTIASFGNHPGFTGLGSQHQPGSYDYRWKNDDLLYSTLLIRFSFCSDSNDAHNEGWMLDNIRFTGGLVPLERVLIEDKIVLFPNPTEDVLYISSESKKITKVEVLDISGKIVLSEPILELNPLRVNSLPPGTYLLRCFADRVELSTFKFQKL